MSTYFTPQPSDKISSIRDSLARRRKQQEEQVKSGSTEGLSSGVIRSAKRRIGLDDGSIENPQQSRDGLTNIGNIGLIDNQIGENFGQPQRSQDGVTNIGNIGLIDNQIGDNFGQPVRTQPQYTSPNRTYEPADPNNLQPINNETIQGFRSAVDQTGSVPGDENYRTPDQIRERVAQIRLNRGLHPDPESDEIWVQRVMNGQASIGDARTAISGKARDYSRDTSAVRNPMEEQPETAPPSDAFGFDPQYNETMNQIESQRAGLRSEEELQRRRLAEDAQKAQREAERQRELGLKANTESMADRGLVHSGINIEAQQDIGEEFMRYTDEISRAQARGEEDLARWLTNQRNNLAEKETQARRDRAEKEALRRELDDMNRAINATPAPTPSGRYQIDVEVAPGVVDQASQGRWSADQNYFGSGNELAERIESIFNNRNVSITSHGETDAQRLARIAREVATGQRTLDDVRESVDRISRSQNL